MGAKDEKVLGLFLAAVLAFTPGCMMGNTTHEHVDRDKDGYCDVDGADMTNSSNRQGYYGSRYFGRQKSIFGSDTTVPSDHISSGALPKGGIGSGHGAGGGG